MRVLPLGFLFFIWCLLLTACSSSPSEGLAENDENSRSNAAGFPACFGELYEMTDVRFPDDARLMGYFNEYGNNKNILASFRLTHDQVKLFESTLPASPRKPLTHERWLTGDEMAGENRWWFPTRVEQFEGNTFTIGQWCRFTYQIEKESGDEYAYLFVKYFDAR